MAVLYQSSQVALLSLCLFPLHLFLSRSLTPSVFFHVSGLVIKISRCVILTEISETSMYSLGFKKHIMCIKYCCIVMTTSEAHLFWSKSGVFLCFYSISLYYLSSIQTQNSLLLKKKQSSINKPKLVRWYTSLAKLSKLIWFYDLDGFWPHVKWSDWKTNCSTNLVG